MKDASQIQVPADARYTATHEWARRDGAEVVIGLTDYAQEQLGDIVFVELPRVGARLAAGAEFGTVESVKAASGIYLPLAGEVTAINEGLAKAPEQVNADPYGAGWLLRLRPADPAAFDALLGPDAYRAALHG